MKMLAWLLPALALACGTTTSETPDGPPGGVTASFQSLYGDYLGNCKQCHAPGAPGRTSDIEQTLDFSTVTTAYSTIKTGMAAGLMGNFAGCNGVPFVGATPGGSLIVAVVDQPTRQAFDVSGHAMCDVDGISDETVKVGSAPSAQFIAALEAWITAGAPNN
jgi:hypothetical protein